MPITERLAGLTGALGALEDALEVRRVAVAVRAAWWEEAWPPPPAAARTIEERHAGLGPVRTRLDHDPRRGRILRTLAPVAAGEVLVAESALVFAEPGGAPPWALVRSLLALEGPAWDQFEDLHDAHPDRHARYAEAARRHGFERDPERAARTLARARTNAFGHGVGGPAAIHPAAAMAAHSCDPSADRFADRGVLFFQARRDLGADEEVTISYLDASLEARVRLPVLLARYGFLCDCPRCAAALARGETDAEEVRRGAERENAAYDEAISAPAEDSQER